MINRRGSAEATQNHVVVYALPCVPDRHVLEQIEVCDHDVVGPGKHLPSLAEHAPRPAVHQPWLAPWEEVPTHVLDTLHEQSFRDIIIPFLALWRCQANVEISGHQHSSPTGPLDDVRDGVLYG